jgi:hypothetical protein
MMTEQFFVYGTLMDPIIQVSVFGRATWGTPDTLTDYKKAGVG